MGDIADQLIEQGMMAEMDGEFDGEWDSHNCYVGSRRRSYRSKFHTPMGLLTRERALSFGHYPLGIILWVLD